MKTRFNRRHLLRGTGAMISLPALESIGCRRFASAADSKPATPPKRMVFLGFGFGVTQETWIPNVEQIGADYDLPEGLAPLARHKEDFTVVQGCSNEFSNEAHWGSTFWLTGANRFSVPGQSMANSISADQVAAQQLGRDTRFASVQLGSPDVKGSGQGPGLSLAWDKRGKPVAGLGTPVQVFHKLFSADDLPLEQRQAAIAEQRSVLDAVVTEARRVQRGLTKTDTDKLDEYFQSIRDIETRLSKDEDWLTVPKAGSPIEEPDPGLKGREEIKVMYDLIVAALQTDSTRVMTYRQPVQTVLTGGGANLKLGQHIVLRPLERILAASGNAKLERGTATETAKTQPLANASGYHEQPSESAEARRARAILTEFAIQAFRGAQPENDFIDRLSEIYEARRAAGDSFDVAIRLSLSVILASPGFLYLNEPTDESLRRELTNRELAVRLSYFLWSAPPDEELLALAERNGLSKPEILRQQVDRLIADPRSDEFVSGFVHQWLDMERLDFFQFDVTLHREFDESTRSAAREEVYQSFAHLLRDRENGRIGKLLKSDTIFVNGLLATYYGIDGVTGDGFQQVSLPADSPRGGLLGMAAIHAMGSDGVESSPVERGAWVLRHLLHDPPPPAPPNVPQLSRLADKPLTTREKLAAHMEEAQCASCHRKIDPIGFGLENFDAAGKWRTTNNHRTKSGRNWKKGRAGEIDASGAFHKGPAFSDYHELRDLIAEREEDFARGFTDHLIEYALGRPIGFTDEDLTSEIVSSAKRKQFALSEFVHTLVQSKAFRTK